MRKQQQLSENIRCSFLKIYAVYGQTYVLLICACMLCLYKWYSLGVSNKVGTTALLWGNLTRLISMSLCLNFRRRCGLSRKRAVLFPFPLANYFPTFNGQACQQCWDRNTQSYYSTCWSWRSWQESLSSCWSCQTFVVCIQKHWYIRFPPTIECRMTFVL